MKRTDKKILLNDVTNGHFREAFRSLASNIQFSGIDKPIKSLLMTSTLPSEGKTTATLSLAQTFAEMGHKTVLIETDMRRPVIRRRLNEKKGPGFINYLAGQASYEELPAIQSPNLYFIDCGTVPPDAVEILNSQRFNKFIEQLYKDYDIIIFDSPPLAVFIDAAILSSKVDGTILLIDSGCVDHKKAQDSLNQLKTASARVLGVVLNNVEVTESDYYYYDYNHNNSK